MPQNRQDGSAFALIYIFLLRSCKSLGVFVIVTFASRVVGKMLLAGCLCSTSVTSLRHYYTPVRHPLIFDSLPGLPVIDSTLLQGLSPWDETGFSSCLYVSLLPCRHYHPAEVI